MDFELQQKLAPDAPADANDVMALKRALNRLGYYFPNPKIGMNEIPDREMFEALKVFQKDRGLPGTGYVQPNDDVLKEIAKALAETAEDSYIWNTMKDGKVRPDHSVREGEMYQWSDGLSPGDEPNCRCWATPVSSCEILGIQLQNAYLQLNEEIEEMTKADKQAKELRMQHDAAFEALKEEMQKGGFDISTSFIPGFGQKIPVLQPMIQTALNATQILTAYFEYSETWGRLENAINNQVYYLQRAEQKRNQIKLMEAAQEKMGCVSQKNP